MIKSRYAAAILGLGLLGAAGPARAQFFMQNPNASGASENIEGFTVAGKGSVAAKPNLVEIDLEVSAASELSADAIVKYRDARRRLREAFTALKLDNVAVEERGLLVDQKSGMMNPYFFNFQQNTRTKTEVQLTRRLIVKASNIRKMDEDAVLPLIAKLLDVAQDAGGRVGGGQQDFNPYFYNPYNQFNRGLVRFVLDDFEKLEEEAYEKAIADAKTRAQRLARLSGVKLGPIVGVREIMVPGERTATPDDETPRKRLETAKFQDIPVRVELLVRFEVRSDPKGKTQGGDR
jgi:uncharacterized protein YggE